MVADMKKPPMEATIATLGSQNAGTVIPLAR
jgi:hypothetical protein